MADPPEPPEEIWEQILLRLPPDDPATLLRASLVCKLWRRIFSRPGFLRRLGELHRAAPVLGFFHDNHMDEGCGTVSFAPIAASAFSLSFPERRSWSVIDCRHGRVLLLSPRRECLYDPITGRRKLTPRGRELLVWEPTTGYKGLVPVVNWGHDEIQDCSTAVICAADGCDHRNCQGGPFHLVTVYSFQQGDDFGRVVTAASVYSSVTGEWSQTNALDLYSIIDPGKASILAGNSVCFLCYPEDFFNQDMLEHPVISGSVDIVKYNLHEDTLDTIRVVDFDMIRAEHLPVFYLVQAEDGGLGIAGISVVENRWVLQRRSWDKATWVPKRTIHLEDVLPPAATLPTFAGFAEGADIVFLATADGIYTVELKIGQARKVCRRVDLHGPLFPFITKLCSEDYMPKVRAHRLQSNAPSSSMFYHELEASNRRLQEQLDEQLKKHEVLRQRHDALESQVTLLTSMLQNFVQTASSSQQQQMSFTPPFTSVLPLAQQQELYVRKEDNDGQGALARIEEPPSESAP